MAETQPLRGIMAEYASLDAVRAAVEELAAEGFHDMDAYLPYPDLRVMERIGRRPSRITRTGGLFGLLGASLAYIGQWLITARVYPLDVGGRPYHSMPAFIPITFEMGVLFCGIATFVITLALCGMPVLWRPEFEIEGFERVSVDRFWVYVAEADPMFDERTIRELLEAHHPLRLIHVPVDRASLDADHPEGPRP